MAIKAFVFDMDGTILHSLPDLAAITNMTLERMGFPQHTEHEVMMFVGNGAERLVRRAVPEGIPEEQVQEALALWRELYLVHGDAFTAPFPGVVETIEALRRRGVKTAVLSNKFDAAVKVLADEHFPGLFDVARGEIPPTPRKPDPHVLLQVIDEMGLGPEDVAYVGDTDVDAQTARNAGVFSIGVTWGYGEAIPIVEDRVDLFIDEMGELLELV